MWNDRFRNPCGLVSRGAVFDPLSLTAASMAMTAVGGTITAASTIAGGNAAATAGEMKQAAANRTALQIESNAAGELAAGQRIAMETERKTRLARSTGLARAAGSGFNAGEGSMVTNDEELAGRGELAALTDMFNGENARTGLMNKAASVRFEGDMDKFAGDATRNASYLSAAGTIAGSAGSMFKTYGDYKYPRSKYA
ncbi:MAG: hypothetical protein V4673_14570 [Pseudomonadota bacterium]